MRVLITGASGFIGSALARALVADGAVVTGTHRSTQPPDIPGMTWLSAALTDTEDAWTRALADADVVVHLAALAHQIGAAGLGRWEEFRRINVDATRMLARASRAAKVRRFVLTSSIAAICSDSAEVLTERSPASPSHDYGRSKLEAERAVQEELHESTTDWCIVRPPLVYGPGNPGNMARLLRLIATGMPLPLASIRNRRSFIFVDNLVDALLTVIGYPQPIRAVFVLSDGSDFSTPELIVALAGAAGRKARLVPAPFGMLRALGRLGDGVSRILGKPVGFDSYSVARLTGSLCVDGTCFREFFHWRPPVGSVDALARTAAALGRPGARS